MSMINKEYCYKMGYNNTGLFFKVKAAISVINLLESVMYIKSLKAPLQKRGIGGLSFPLGACSLSFWCLIYVGLG